MLSQPFGSGGLTVSSSVVESPVADTVDQLIADEEKVFLRRQPRSTELIALAGEHLAGGATSNWQIAQPQAVWMSHGTGSKVYDVDGTEYVDMHGRSEERRVGKEGRSRGSPYH